MTTLIVWGNVDIWKYIYSFPGLDEFELVSFSSIILIKPKSWTVIVGLFESEQFRFSEEHNLSFEFIKQKFRRIIFFLETKIVIDTKITPENTSEAHFSIPKFFVSPKVHLLITDKDPIIENKIQNKRQTKQRNSILFSIKLILSSVEIKSYFCRNRCLQILLFFLLSW